MSSGNLTCENFEVHCTYPLFPPHRSSPGFHLPQSGTFFQRTHSNWFLPGQPPGSSLLEDHSPYSPLLQSSPAICMSTLQHTHRKDNLLYSLSLSSSSLNCLFTFHSDAWKRLNNRSYTLQTVQPQPVSAHRFPLTSSEPLHIGFQDHHMVI